MSQFTDSSERHDATLLPMFQITIIREALKPAHVLITIFSVQCHIFAWFPMTSILEALKPTHVPIIIFSGIFCDSLPIFILSKQCHYFTIFQKASIVAAIKPTHVLITIFSGRGHIFALFPMTAILAAHSCPNFHPV